MRHQGKTFRNKVVELDGNEFDGCDIQQCTLIYRGGGGGVKFINSTVAYNKLTFEDNAANTINFLRDFYHGGFHDAIQPVIDDILNNVRP
jgi:hypothetical protein